MSKLKCIDCVEDTLDYMYAEISTKLITKPIKRTEQH